MAKAVLRGIFGGTFDPLHIGHLRTVLDVQQALDIENVHLIPNNTPPHRDQPHISAEQRYTLLQKALSEHEGLVADRREIERDGASYMVDTLRSFRQEFPGDRLCLIIGTDAYRDFCQWHDWQGILQLAHIVVMSRAGEQESGNEALGPFRVESKEALLQIPAGKVFMQPVTQLEISATRIRSMLKHGQSVRYLVPEQIRTDIETLYKG